MYSLEGVTDRDMSFGHQYGLVGVMRVSEPKVQRTRTLKVRLERLDLSSMLRWKSLMFGT